MTGKTIIAIDGLHLYDSGFRIREGGSGLIIKKKNNVRIIGNLIAIIAFLAWVFWSNRAIQITTYKVKSPRISDNLSGFTIAHVSDLHNQKFGYGQRNLISKIAIVKPHIIAVTGDLVDSRSTDIDMAMIFIKEAAKVAPVYYVTGNHEARIEDYDELKQRLEIAGAHIMDGQIEEIFHNDEIISLMGVADPSFTDISVYVGEGETVANDIRSISYDKDSYSILLSHRPELFQVYVSAGLDLVLAGHAHGGQFRIPFIGGVIAPNQGYLPKYTSGIIKDGKTKMIVSRGMGSSIIPMRINNRPELVVVRLSN